jgi:hypothetical protein
MLSKKHFLLFALYSAVRQDVLEAVRQECLSRMIFFGEVSPQRAGGISAGGPH